ncbi:BACON domain-containing protein [Methanosarcina sp. 1.H.A.2.2]|uniref:BACON domain-containing protein n=1 Tax=Methanosarcina sp. 1.H.A.2.2 TaxID=1483601 RepID=UPI0006225575|nr:BACON domain-containing carbohydrate-binding protein [Methanosarcina sp. 1.H.A.2.2]KKH46622.1 hypothetical protein EO93_10590 [Methanosarcina sp. 1.H.A.2.2]
MGDTQDHEEIKEPVKDLAKEITQKYTQELTREAIKKAIKSKRKDLSETEIKRLESQLKKLTDSEKATRFKEASEEISREILEGNITAEKAIEEISTVLESSLETKVSFLARAALSLKNIPLPVKIAILIIFPLTAAIALFIMPSLSMAPGDLNFDLNEGESDSDQFHVSNTGGGVLLWTASSDQPWISLNPERGANEGSVIVLVDAEDMEEGTYEGTITIESSAGTEQCQVNLVVGSEYPGMIVNPHSIEFYLAEGEVASRELQISKEGSGTLEWHISPGPECPWISLSRESGTNSDTLTVTANTEGLEPGTYEGTITIESNAGTEQCPMRLVVGSQPPVLAVDPLSIGFELEEGESGEEELRISNDGGGMLEWEASADESWITLSPERGINSGTVTVTVDTDDLSPGEEYEGTITIESNAENEECIIYLNVLREGEDKEDPILAVDPDPLSFNFNLLEGESDSEEFYISNEGGGDLKWNIVLDPDWSSWISINPDAGINLGTVTFSVDSSDLDPGQYTATFEINSNVGAEEGTVNLTVYSEETEGPDLVAFLEVTGDATTEVEENDYYLAVPISVTVRNQGDEAADIFKISTEYTNLSGTYSVAFRVPGESSIWYPYTDAPLAPGEQITFNGDVLFRVSLDGETVSLTAVADSCSEDEFKPAYCRVEESNEENNQSPAVEIHF